MNPHRSSYFFRYRKHAEALYDALPDDQDVGRFAALRRASAHELASGEWSFADERLPELLFRYRARNYPDSLNELERERWQEYRYQRLTEPDGGGTITMDAYLGQLDQLRGDPEFADQMPLMDELALWADLVLS